MQSDDVHAAIKPPEQQTRFDREVEWIIFNACGRDDLNDDFIRWLRNIMHAKLGPLANQQAELEAESAKLRKACEAVLNWYDRDGSVGGACDPMEDLKAALGKE